jgi:hypothetical protein
VLFRKWKTDVPITSNRMQGIMWSNEREASACSWKGFLRQWPRLGRACRKPGGASAALAAPQEAATKMRQTSRVGVVPYAGTGPQFPFMAAPAPDGQGVYGAPFPIQRGVLTDVSLSRRKNRVRRYSRCCSQISPQLP